MPSCHFRPSSFDTSMSHFMSFLIVRECPFFSWDSTLKKSFILPVISLSFEWNLFPKFPVTYSNFPSFTIQILMLFPEYLNCCSVLNWIVFLSFSDVKKILHRGYVYIKFFKVSVWRNMGSNYTAFEIVSSG